MKTWLIPALLAALLTGCAPGGSTQDGNAAPQEEPASLVKEGWNTIRWDFDTADGWVYNHQDDATFPQWKLQDGILSLSTRAGTRDRSKMRTVQENFGEGLYTWRINIPLIAQGEQVSVAGFIYVDDAHELDFEVGYGTAVAREGCGAAPGQMVACMTNQSFPYTSHYAPVAPGWHDFAISLLTGADGKYTARWLIDGEVKQTQQLMFGPETVFRIMCSVENLTFMGDHIPEYNTTASFDWVTYEGPVTRQEPEPEPEPEPEQPSDYEETRWDFDNLDGWYYYTHNPEQGSPCYTLSNGILSIFTRANTLDRNKLQTSTRNYGEGIYTWRMYIPEVEPGAQLSVAGFIYKDDKHELDYEIGYGKASARESCGAGEGDLVACLTNQANPHNSTYVKIKPGWHTCAIRMDLVNNLYKATWIIDGEQVKTLQLSFGSSTRFQIICSVENLTFMGDRPPTRDHTAQFDWVSYQAPKQ